MGNPRLVTTAQPRDPAGVALVLHGGGARRDTMMVSPTQLSVLRMIPVAHRVARAGGGRLAVFRLLNSSRGWDTRQTPVADVRWAMAELERKLPGLPAALVGHSLGGRAALLAGSARQVRSVVALNPSLLPADSPDLDSSRVLFVHGDDDRIASPHRSAETARQLMARGDVGYVRVPGGRHAMLRHGRVFERAAAEFVAATLLDRPPRRPGVVQRVLDGEEWVTA